MTFKKTAVSVFMGEVAVSLFVHVGLQTGRGCRHRAEDQGHPSPDWTKTAFFRSKPLKAICLNTQMDALQSN